MAAVRAFYSALVFYEFLQYIYVKHTSFNISYNGDWIHDRFEVFLTKINSVERSDFYLECMKKLTQRTVMEKWRTFDPSGRYVKTSSRNNYFFIIALLLSGDVSLNAGPIKYPCIGCSKPVKSNQQALQCDFCDLWIHRKCTNPLMAEQDYRRLGQSTDNFYCNNCVTRLPVLSDSFFNVSDLVEETFSSDLNNLTSSSCLSFNETTTNQSRDPAFQESHDSESHDINSDQHGGSHDVFEELRKAKRKNCDNIFITYLNVNSFRYEFMEVGEILYDKLSDDCFFSETKLDDSFIQHSFNVPGYIKRSEMTETLLVEVSSRMFALTYQLDVDRI